MGIEDGFMQDLVSIERSGQVARILGAALAAADPAEAVKNALRWSGDQLTFAGQTFPVTGPVRVIGAGKAAQAMARGLVAVLGERVKDGVLITKHLEPENGGLPEKIRVLPGGHPVPTAESVSSAHVLVDFLHSATEQDFVICLISGGGSALMTLPQEGVSLEDMQELTRQLLASGANIGEINTLRKHLDRVKGGGLARLAAPARMITLILSDVIGSPLDVIASGPTVADSSTFANTLHLLQKYQLEDNAPANILSVLRRGANGELPETLKENDPLLKLVTNAVIASNPQAAEAALQQARQEGFHTLLLTTYLQGEASQAGVVLASLLKQIEASGQPLPRPACLVAGGETTVTLRGKGMGGRNQEMALGAAFLLEGMPDAALVTLGTDGEDGPTDAAGAFVTGDSLARARSQGLDALAYLQNNDSYHFFKAMRHLVNTGPTGTNVNDLAFLFAF